MDATLAILRSDSEYSFLWHPSVGLSGGSGSLCLYGVVETTPEIQVALQQSADEAAQILNLQSQQAVRTSSGFAPQAPFMRLGRVLYGQILPPQIQEAIRQLPDRATLALITNDVNLPWELLHDGQEFLAIRHTIGRVLPQVDVPRPQPSHPRSHLTCLLLGNPTGNLAQADAEIEAIADLLDQAPNRVRYDFLLRDQISTVRVLELFASGDYDLIHFAGHAQPGALRVADGWLRTQEIQRAINGRPVVYLNACASAREITTSPVDLANVEQQTQHLAGAFLRGGAAALIGMLWPIPDQSSYSLSLEFYRSLVRGFSVGEALRQSRVSLRGSDSAGISWLAPVLYGDPRLRPIRFGLVYRPGTVVVVYLRDATSPRPDRSLEERATTVHRQLQELRTIIDRCDGITIEVNSACLIALFGVYRPTENDAISALRSACEIRAAISAWGLAAPMIGVASGEIAAEPLQALPATGDSLSLRQPLLIGAPVAEAFALAQNAQGGQILVNDLVLKLAKSRYRFSPFVYNQQLVHELESSLLEVSSPQPVAEPGNSVGRERERRRLCDDWEEVRQGRGRIVGIVGEAGVGKTHLLAEFYALTEAENRRWLQLTCTPDAQNTPYGMLAQLFRALLGIPVHAEAAAIEALIRARLAGLPGSVHRNASYQAQLLLDILGFAQADLQVGEQAIYHRRLLIPLQFLLGEEVNQQPIILVLEDAHWIDEASCNVFTQLTDGMLTLPILLLLLYRPGWDHSWFDKSSYRHLPLAELDRAASIQLLHAYLQAEELPKELLEVVGRTGGNPLFLKETIRSLQERGILTRQATGENGSSRWVLQQSLAFIQLPDSVQRTLQLRFGQLAEETHHILALAAVMGVRFNPTLLAQISETEEAHLLAQLTHLKVIEFIRPLWGTDEYEFRHAAIQEAAYLEIAISERRMLHARIAAALEKEVDHDPVAPNALARHYYLSLIKDDAGPEPSLIANADPLWVQKTLGHLMQSGQRALERYAIREAITFFTWAKRVCSLLPGSFDLWARTYAGLGDAYHILGQFENAQAYLRQAYATLHMQPLNTENRTLASDLARRIARLYAWEGEAETALAWIDTGLEKLQNREDESSKAVLAMLRIHAGSIHYHRGDYDAAIPAYEAGIQIAEEIHADNALAEGFLQIGVILSSRGQFEQALAYCNRCLEIRQRLGDTYQVARVEGNIGIIHYYQAAWETARTYHERSRSFWAEIGDQEMLAHTSLNLGNVALCLGDWNSTQRYYEEALELWTKLKNQRGVALCHNNLGLLANEQEAWEQARQHLEMSRASASQDMLAEALTALAEVALGQQRIDDALELARSAATLATTLAMKFEQAIALRMVGRALAATGKLEEGRQQLEHSHSLLKTLASHYEAARTTYRLAELEAMAGNLAQAQQHCTAAIDVFQQLGAQKDLARATRFIEKLRGDPA